VLKKISTSQKTQKKLSPEHKKMLKAGNNLRNHVQQFEKEKDKKESEKKLNKV
jgi:hypothetical protein